MDKRRPLLQTVSICFFVLIIGLVSMLLSACGQVKSPTRSPILPPVPTSNLELPTDTPLTSFPSLSSPTPNCTADLLFIADVTIPDNTNVTPGSLLDKQWLVQNNGDCNWDAGYRLRHVAGDTLGAVPEQALFPARAGTQANLRILFTAPQLDGDYISEWQAFDANGIPFGESFVIKITVQQ